MVIQQAQGEFNDENSQLQFVFRGQSDTNMSPGARNADKSTFRIPLHCCACIIYMGNSSMLVLFGLSSTYKITLFCLSYRRCGE